MKRLLAGLLMVLLALPLQAREAQTDVLTLGVFAYRPKPVMEAMYAPLADYLSQQLGDTRVELRILDQEEIAQAMARNQLDFLFTNPSHYLVVRSRSTLSGALATVVRLERNTPTSVLGGVIITRADHPDIHTLQNLKGRRIAIPGTRYLGGYQSQAYELLQEGIQLPEDAQLVESGSHDAVVQAVLGGQADAGFIRTSIIESLTDEGRLDPTRLRVIHPQKFTGYPFISSTRLYPEWPFVALHHVEARTVQRIASALLLLQADHPAARAAGFEGFAPPADYLPVENLARALHMPPYDVVSHIRLHDVVREYRGWLLAIMTLIVLLAAGGLAFLLQNRRLRSSQAALGQQTRRLNEVIWGTNIGTWEWNIQTGEAHFNERWAEIAGYSLAELTPVSIETRTRLTHPDDLACSDALLEQCFRRERDTYECEVRMRHKDGRWVWVLDRGRVVEWTEDGRPLRMSGTLQDITHIKAHQKELEHIAHHDALTGLPNRLLLADRMHQAMVHGQRRGTHLAVVYLDLDGFKAVNDTFGHDTGDALLIALVARIQAALRQGDTLARLGGDEFVVVLVDLEHKADAIPVLERLLEAASTPLDIRGQSLKVSASLGVSFYPQDDVDADMLLRQADHAMYLAKQGGRNRYRLFDA